MQTLEEGDDGDSDRPPFLRVGHGVLFWHALHLKDMGSDTSRSFCTTMGSKAKDLLLGGTVPIEINQTSNDTLLSNAKKAFFELRAKNVPVVLATDDDGIWR